VWGTSKGQGCVFRWLRFIPTGVGNILRSAGTRLA